MTRARDRALLPSSTAVPERSPDQQREVDADVVLEDVTETASPEPERTP
jgi:hypothetical protein